MTASTRCSANRILLLAFVLFSTVARAADIIACQRTDSAPPVALHFASQRRSYLYEMWHPQTRTSSVLIWLTGAQPHLTALRPAEPFRPVEDPTVANLVELAMV